MYNSSLYNRLTFYIDVSRYASFYVNKVIVGATMLIVILMMSFLLEPTDSNRFCICIYVLSGLIAYLFVIAQYTPILPYDTILDAWLQLCFVSVMCVTFVHSLLAYIKIHEDALEEARLVHEAQGELELEKRKERQADEYGVVSQEPQRHHKYEVVGSKERSSAATALDIDVDTAAASASEIEMTGVYNGVYNTGATSANDSPTSGGGASSPSPTSQSVDDQENQQEDDEVAPPRKRGNRLRRASQVMGSGINQFSSLAGSGLNQLGTATGLKHLALGLNLTVSSKDKDKDTSHDALYWSRKRLDVPYLGIMSLFQLIDLILMISFGIIFVIASSVILTGNDHSSLR